MMFKLTIAKKPLSRAPRPLPLRPSYVLFSALLGATIGVLEKLPRLLYFYIALLV